VSQQPSPYTFSNISFAPGTTTVKVVAATTGTHQGSSAVSQNITFSALGTETVGLPLVSLSNITFAGTTSYDNVVYYSTGTTMSFPVNSLGFSNLVKVNSYPGSNTFFSIGGNTYAWSNIFTPPNPLNDNQLANSIPVNNIPLATNSVNFTVRNAVGSNVITKTFAFAAALTGPVIANINSAINTVTRSYANGVSFGSTDVIYSPALGQFATSITNAMAAYDYKPNQTLTGNGYDLYLNVTPITDIPLIAFSITHYSTVDDIYVQWTDISATYYQASIHYALANGCGDGSQSGSMWFIRRPQSLDQLTPSVISVKISYASSVTTFNVPLFA
jgi:hypothetical protein